MHKHRKRRQLQRRHKRWVAKISFNDIWHLRKLRTWKCVGKTLTFNVFKIALRAKIAIGKKSKLNIYNFNYNKLISRTI